MRRLIMSHLIKIYTVFHSVLKFDWDLQLKQWFCTRFKDGRLHFRKSGINGLMQKQNIPCHSSEESETLRGLNTFSGKATVKVVSPPFWKGVYSKRKKKCTSWEKSLAYYNGPHFRKGLTCRKANRKSQKLSPLSNEKNPPSVSSPLKDRQLTNK